MDILVLVLIGIVVLFVSLFIIGYNSIVAKEQNVRRAYSDIDVWISRVAQLIPNLINTLKGSARFERETLTRLAQAYQGYVSNIKTAGAIQDKVQAASAFFGAVYPIILQLPNYPELKSVEGFQKVMEELRVAVDKVAYARQYYNQAVQDFNTYIQVFPWVIFAKLMGKREYPFFEYEKRESILENLESGELTEGLENI